MTITGVNYNYALPYNNPVYHGSTAQTPTEVTTTTQTGSADILDISAENERCTDGKDDGKIGFFSAAWNAIKGVGKTVAGAIKGMFTNKEGKFSLGKTLLSAGLIAASIACPAVGVALCAVGGVMGAVQIGKGIYGAATAKSDAEAKEAWQNIGGGAFTVGLSVAGARSGVKTMKASSTAADGLASVAKGSGAKAYAKAFLSDAKSSTVNNITAIKNSSAGQTVINAVKNPKDTFSHAKNSASKIGAEVLDKAKHPIQTAKTVAGKVGEHVTKDSVKTALSKLSPKQLAAKVKTLPSSAKNLYNILQKEGTMAAINKYGYSESSIAELMATLGGTVLAENNV